MNIWSHSGDSGEYFSIYIHISRRIYIYTARLEGIVKLIAASPSKALGEEEQFLTLEVWR